MAEPYAGGDFRIERVDALDRALREAGQKVKVAAAAALFREASDIISESVPLVPWDKGHLAASHFVHAPRPGGDGEMEVTFGYGSQSVTYAVIQHEREDFQHPRGGQAKYLSSVIERHGPTLGVELAAHIRWFLRRSGL